MSKELLSEIFNFKNKTILITGSTGFFGRYIAKTFLDVGASVILMGRSREKLRSQLDEYSQKYGNGKAKGICVDFYNRIKLQQSLIKITQKNNIDVLINNAYDISPKTAFNTPKGQLENSTYNQWAAAFESGIYWAVITTQIVGKQFKQKRQGSIINISSMYGIVSPNPLLYEGTKFLNPPTYSVCKAGIIAFTRYVAAFWGKYGIRCNAIAPGPFSNTETQTNNSVSPEDPFLERLKQRTVLNRIGHPNDLRGALILLASDASSYITGQTIIIDGGWTIT